MESGLSEAYEPMKHNLIILILWVVCTLSMLTSLAQNIKKAQTPEQALEEANDPHEKLGLYLKLINDLQNNYPEKALEFAGKALKIAENEKDDSAKLIVMNRMADICKRMTDYKRAMEMAMKAIALSTSLGNNIELAEAHGLVGRIYIDLGEYKQSSGHLFESLKLSEKTDFKPGIAKSLNNIGYLYFEQKNYDKALGYYLHSLAISREINDSTGISRGLNNVAAIYSDRHQTDTAVKYILEAVKINIRKGQRLWEGVNYLNLGEISQDHGNYEDALKYHNKGVAIFKEINSMVMLSAAYLNLSEYYRKTGDEEKSLEYAEKAFKIGQENGLKKTVMEAAEKLHAIYLKKDDLKTAYRFGMIRYQIKDSLGLEESMIKLTKLELQYGFEKQNQENKLVQQRKDYLVIILIICLFMIIVVVFLLMARQKIKSKNIRLSRQKLQDEVEFKNKELTLNVMNLIRKNEILAEISNRLMLIEKETVEEGTKKAIITIARDLNKSSEEEIWEEFELRFKQVHGEFYDRLMRKFPDLSPSDLKLCAFLRLNMTSKEIGKMTGQRLKSLEIARHRLRKKLGISNTQTNLVTFLAQT